MFEHPCSQGFRDGGGPNRAPALLFLALAPLVFAPGGGAQKPPLNTPAFTTFAPAESVPPITEAKFFTREQAEAAYRADEPVVGLAVAGEARAYSVWLLERRLVVNDTIAGRAIAVTWCPFSHTAVVYLRNVAAPERELTLEADGRLFRGALVLRDRETRSAWTQADGAAFEGSLAGKATLTPLPAIVAAWKVWKQEQPATLALEKPADLAASQYAEYYADPHKLGLGGVELKEPRMGGKMLVVGIVAGPDRAAIPLERLKRDLLVSTVADRQAVAALYDPATGTVRVVRREARGHVVTLRRGYGDIFGKPTAPFLVDEETASRWDFTGRAISGRMQGHRLPLFPHRVQFWYAWQAYFPKSRVE